MTVALCTKACDAQGFNTSGVEYSGECFCGNGFSNGGAPAPDGLVGCNMLCNGNSTEYCGGSNRLNVYTKGARSIIAPDWAPLGCYTDSVNKRTLSFGANVAGGAANMTNNNCQAACYKAGYTVAGTEYSGECYCDTQVRNGGGPAPDGDAQCVMSCNGDSKQVCGGPDRLTVYQYVGSNPPSTTPTDPQPPANPDPPVENPIPADPTPTPSIPKDIPAGWSYSGCYVDNKYGRILKTQQPDSSAMMIEYCIGLCVGQGHSMAGIEYSAQCFCGDAMINGGAKATADSQCAMPCSGNSSEVCGGPDRMSIYANTTFTTYPPPSAQTTGLPAGFAYKGCLQDVPARVLPYQLLAYEKNLTVPMCLSRCAAYGYSAAGVEYGEQCFCGDDTDRISANTAYTLDSNCNFNCVGDPGHNCGGAGLLNYYVAPGINNWQQAVGDAAGQYKFLVPGVVIPLITTASRNGKVMFVEKQGTGPPNSTGAFELDLSASDDFSKAWRTVQGIKTDVFCSAGLTLPDKKGRQINIGGWSTDSLFGVRFFTPDGAPGIAGESNWEENVEEVAMQVGRWYPSALQLVNGSLLIVGGEDGSNGKPVPNLEVLPRPAGGQLVHCDWLLRTDPNNLYPFLAILPSGGIFVQYYNEAIILDEQTFEITRQLPNVPGAVNSDTSGRTYPLEGSMMILPQKAPYTDPLKVLICGGGTAFGGPTLDNCVSITPEDPTAKWELERMPSKRVIPTMVALPDGTYLIMNGAMQGVAGFGLADIPNHNAVMYDPVAPKGSRFTKLASTTIDRMYHNEVLLLQDGRVLVSGSDPQDYVLQRFPQEYRVEVFVPPYLHALNEPLAINISQPLGPNVTLASLASNATAAPFPTGNSTASPYGNSTSNATHPECSYTQRPVYVLNTQGISDPDDDISYMHGDTISITMICGTAAKISLMGAVSTTHGNSMGQRTIFPAFTCSGSTCTIQTPPTSHITGGPGWFMVFVLNEKNIPSFAHWVRIGGDPAGLGNWPQHDDFTLPGV